MLSTIKMKPTVITLPVSKNRVQRVRHEIKRRALTVARVESISPHVRRIVFTGDDLADFNSASFDDHIKFILDTDAAEPVRRDYTPRSFDAVARELTLEFALHGDGPAASWAQQAQPGQQAVVAGPKGSLIIPLDYDWHLLVGDDTAMPAIARRLEELPSGARVTVILQVPDAADRRTFDSAASVTLQWVDSANAMLGAVRAWNLPAGDGYAWCAGEAAAMAALRKILIDEKGHDRHGIRAAAYWKQGAVAHHENIED